MPKNNNLFWVDLEMTGLGDEQVIVEIASLVTDADLNILAEGPELAIHRTPEEMSRMEEWPARQHKKSGLIDRIKASKIDVAEAEKQTLEFLKKWTVKDFLEADVVYQYMGLHEQLFKSMQFDFVFSPSCLHQCVRKKSLRR